MTRETKIGLLVGLAFIIVIGILLSDHINVAGDPLRADMTKIDNAVKEGVNAPNARQPGTTDTVLQPQPVVPRNPIRTEAEVEPRQNSGTTVINIGPGGDPSQLPPPPARQQQQQQFVQGPVQPEPEHTNTQGPVTLSPGNGQVALNNRQPNPEPANNGSTALTQLQNTARNHNEELVAPGGSQNGVSFPKPPEFVARSEGRQVVAEENDTVSKFATKYMGANTKANREAIIKANPSVGPDGSKVFAGKTYTIPAPQGAPAQPATSASQAVAQIPPPVAQQPVRLNPQAVTPAPIPASTAPMYTVKDTDTLWKIA